jgi:hypothetical protein
MGITRNGDQGVDGHKHHPPHAFRERQTATELSKAIGANIGANRDKRLNRNPVAKMLKMRYSKIYAFHK